MKSGVAVSMQLPGLQLLGPVLEYARQSHFVRKKQKHRGAVCNKVGGKSLCWLRSSTSYVGL